jgi:MFS family permease
MAATDASGAWAPLRREPFRVLWIAQFVSNVGTWMQSVGAVWVMVDLKASPTEIALVQTATTLPVVFFGIIGGAVADLVDRRRVLLVTQAIMLVAAGALALLDGVGTVTPISLLVLTFALGVGTALNNPAWQAIQPELVPSEELPQALTLGGASINLGRAIGPAVGGLLVAAAGPSFVFLLNALSFGAVIAVLAWWRRDPDASDGPPERFMGAVRAGTRYALYSRALAGVLVRAGVFSAASAGLLALLPVYSTAVLGLGSGGFGLLLAGFGVGATVAAGFLPALRARISEDAVVATGTLGVAAALLGLALNDTTAVAMVLVVLAGAAWLLCLSTLNVASQQAVPGWVRARGLALYLSVFMGGIAVGSAGWGVVGDSIGSQGAFTWGALAVALTPLLALRWSLSSASGVDLSPAPMFAPEMRFAPEDATGPVLVTLTYDVRPGVDQAFLSALKRVGRARRRTGAVQWAVYRDAEQPDQFIETFVVPTWEEHLRQHGRRTATDAELQGELRPFLRDGDLPHAKHYIAPSRAERRV